MTRIFLTLALLSTALLGLSFFLGLGIDDPRVREAAVQQGIDTHMKTALGGLVFGTLVHAIVFTYFMGTGRWIEETTRAYKLSPDFHVSNQSVKYRLLPGITLAFVMLVMTGGMGAAADPGSPVQFKGWLGLSPATIHMTTAIVTLLLNLAVNVHEFRSIERNGEIVEGVMNEVRRIRTERGLPV